MKRNAKKAFASVLSLALVLGMSTILQPEIAGAKKKVVVKKITVTSPSGKTAYVAKGKKIKLSATVKVTPNKKANKKVTYKSANKKIATVTSKGVVKGKKIGKTKITIISKKNKKKKATITVVVKKAVKSLKMNRTTATMAPGETGKLSVTFSPAKDISTKLAWSTSNQAIATVNQSGAVTAVKEGTATITAKTLDGTNKKATCRVTVGAGIADVKVLSYVSVRVKLTSPKALSASDFKIHLKETKLGSFNKMLYPEKVTSSDGGKTYDIILKSGSIIYNQTYLRVVIDRLAFNTAKELYVENVPGDTDAPTKVNHVITSYRKGDRYSEQWGFSTSLARSKEISGYIKYTSITELPKGLTAYFSEDKTTVKVSGKFENIEDGTKVVLYGIDEESNSFIVTYTFYVGDKNTIAGGVKNRPIVAYRLDNPDTEVSEESGYDFAIPYHSFKESWISVSGGSGEYIHSISGLPEEIGTMDEEGNITVATDAKGNRVEVPTGSYPITYTITDKNNSNVSKTLEFTLDIVEGVVLKGVVRDADKMSIAGATLIGTKEIGEDGNLETFQVNSDRFGSYYTRVLPGEYSRYALLDGKAYQEEIGISCKSGTLIKDYVIPVYKTYISPQMSDAKRFEPMSDGYTGIISSYGQEYGIQLDANNNIYAYLEAGTYYFDSGSLGSYVKVYDEEDVLLGIHPLNSLEGYFQVGSGGKILPLVDTSISYVEG